jgi:hypothetical protein
MIYTRLSHLPIATGYLRVVHGGRGDYVEFAHDQIIWANTFVPDGQKYRLRPNMNLIYYIEHRSVRDYVKIYEQKRTVNYADYKIGCIYIAPADIKQTKETS